MKAMAGKGRYGMAEKTLVLGTVFHSKKEARRYADLKLMEQAGVVRNIELQPAFPIEIGGVKIIYGSGRQLKYVADFRYYDNEKKAWIIEDVKGHLTDVYKIKKALMAAMGNEIKEI